MNGLKTIIVVALLGFWLAATNHCRLEQVPVLNFMSCCEGTGNSQDADCEKDGCAQVEDGLYKSESHHIQVVAPFFCIVTFLAPAAERDGMGDESVRGAIPTLAPPELPKSWQFSFRAAAPPRAPSTVS